MDALWGTNSRIRHGAQSKDNHLQQLECCAARRDVRDFDSRMKGGTCPSA